MDFKKNRYNPYGTEQDELPQSSGDIPDPAVSAAPVTDATLLASASPIGESFDEERVQKVAIGAQLETETGLIIQNHNSRLEIAEFNWFGYNSKTLLVGEKSTINFSLGSQGMSEFSFDYFALHNHSTVINFYDADGNLIGSEKLFYTGSVTAKQFDIKTLSFTAPAGMLIARAELITGDEPGVGDYGFHIDNVSWTSAGLIPVGFTFDRMDKDSGSSGSDFITKDGSEGRSVEGTLSRALAASETLQFWDGSKWVYATVTGMNWQAQDDTLHSADWEYKLRVVDAAGNATPEQSHQVVLDTTPSDVLVTFGHMDKDDGTDARDWETTDGSAGRTVYGSLNKALSAGDIIEYSLDGGKTWLALSVAADNSWSFNDNAAYTSDWEYQVRITDIAGNVTVPITQTVTLAEIMPVITEMWDNHGGNDLVAHNGYSDDLTPTLKGTGQPGATLDVYAFYSNENYSKKIGSVLVKADGTWEWTPSAALQPGEITFDMVTKTGLASDPVTLNLVSAPTVDKAFDNAGQTQEWLANGDATDDSAPRLYGKALPDSLVYIYDNGSLIASVTADASGAWEWEHATGMSVGRHSITVKMEKGAFQSDFSQPWEFEYVSMQPVSFTLTSMQKDTGSSQTDFITNDGSASREVTGTLSRALSATETLQFWNGSAWVNATVTGMSWKAQDATAHSADWEYKLRVVNSLGDVSPEQDFQVVLDTTPSDVQVTFDHMTKDDGSDTRDWETTDGSAGRTVHGTLSKALSADDIIEYSLDGGKTWLALSVAADNSWSFTDGSAHTGDWEYQVRITDIAGNVTVPVKQAVTLTEIAPVITEIWDDVGNSRVVPHEGYTDDFTPRLVGTGHPNSQLEIWAKYGSDKLIKVGTVDVKADGTWTWTQPTPVTSENVRYAAISSSGLDSALYDIKLVKPPTIEKAYDDAGQTQDWLANGDATDDSAPRLYGKALPDSLVYLYDNGSLIASVTADASGAWEWEHATGMSVGRHSITVKMEKGAFQSDFSQPWEFEYVSMQPVSFTLTSMQKDTGSSQTDFITNDGSANREVSGTLSRALSASETLQFWNGSAWVNASVTGMNWKAQDATAHSADWEYKLRVVNSLGDVSPEQDFQVVLDTTPSAVQAFFVEMSKDDGTTGDWQTSDGSAGRSVSGIFDRKLDAGDIAEFSLDGGKTWHPLTVNNLFWSFTDNTAHTTNWEYQVRITDIAGNTTTPVKQSVVLGDAAPAITEVWDDVGGSNVVLQNGYSDDLTPRLKGTGTPGDKIFIFLLDKSGTGTGHVFSKPYPVVDSKGNWEWTSPTPWPLGKTEVYVFSQKTGAESATYTFNLVEGPTIEKAFDDAGQTSEWLTNGATTDDSTPRLYGKALAGSLVYIYDNGKLISSVTADTNGAWEWEHATGMSVGKHSITVKMEKDAFQSDFSPPWEFEYVSMQPITFTLTSMEKDTGISQTDLITNDGSANREVVGKISRKLVAGETLQFWNGSAWINATVTGKNWKAQDATAHTADWIYKLRVVDADGNFSPEKEFQVIYDITPSDNQLKFVYMEKDSGVGAASRDWITDDGSQNRRVYGTLDKSHKVTGVIVEYSLDGGKTWAAATLNGEQAWWFTDDKAHTSDWEYQVRAVDVAGNVSAPVKQNVTLEQIIEPTIGSVWDYVGGSDMVPQHGLSDDRHSTFKGTGKPNDIINFWVINTKGDIVAQGNAPIDSNGNWSWTPIQELPLGDVIFQILESSGKPLPSYPITIVAPPTIEKAFDDVKNVALPSGATSADWSPEFAGKALPNSVVQIYDGNKRIDSVKADANGAWEWEYAGGLSVGLHKINVKMKVGTFLSSSSADWEFIYANPVTIKLSQMDKDTGSSQTDFITNDGTAGRNVTGTLSKALGAGETLNFWNGVSWSKATVTGTTWTARDNAAHSGNWQYRLQVADSKNNVLADQIKNVVLDKSTTAPAIERVAVNGDNWGGYVGHYGKTKDRTPTLEGHVEKGATVTIQYGIDNGAWLGTATVKADSIDGRWLWTPTTPLYDEAWDFRIQYTDQAGNTSAWSPQFTIVIDNKSTFSNNDIAVNAEWDGSGIHGVTLDDNAPLAINTLNITGSNQSLDLSALQKTLSALNTIDLSGDGDNQLTLSAEDVLALGQHALFIDDDKKQIQVKGNEGDSAILARQLENFDANEWVVAKGTITSSGVEYHVWHNQNSDVEILIQAGLKTELM
ncbi:MULTISPECIES: Ig-like domain-containing protein [Pantoea]|nr:MULTISPECIES: Ig-like domain-containing protein [Pantoea]